MIDRYLNELRARLRLPGRHRRRVMAEVKDHLECVATELRAAGVDNPEREAIARFGPAQELAQTFLEQEAARGGMRVGQVAGLFGVLAGALLAVAPGRPAFDGVFPSGVAAFVLGQVALVAGVLTFARAWGTARTGGPRLGLIARGGSVVLGCALAGTLYGAVRALTAGGTWGPDAWTALAILAVGTGATAATLARGLHKARAASVTLALPEHPDALSDIHAAVVVTLERAGRSLPPLRRAAALALTLPAELTGRAPRLTAAVELRRHPWRFAVIVSIAAGLAAAVGHGLTEEPTVQHMSRQLAAGAIIAGAEALASLLGFALLGRYLGLRSGTAAPTPEP